MEIKNCEKVAQKSPQILLPAIESQLTFTYSKVTIETLEKCMKYVQVNNYKHQNDINYVILVFSL